MRYSFLTFVGQCLAFFTATSLVQSRPNCRTQPEDPAFPNERQFSQLNDSVDGRLVAVVPSAKFCRTHPGGCTDAEWTDSIFRSDIPGAMLQVNWEQDYASNPPSLCFRNSTTCGQGSVPLLAINATSAAHIQAGVGFAQRHNLRVAIKASGHDYLGRSTAKNSLLLWTRYLENITFHDSFIVGGRDLGSAVTAGSGVGLYVLYQACKTRGKIFVGGAAANVVAAGGYIQGGGHSPISPLLGLAADNVLGEIIIHGRLQLTDEQAEFEVVTADGNLVTANEVTNSDLFWALRGGGAGTWGVIISATFRTYPTFNVIAHQVFINASSSTEIGKLATLHAQHINDWDKYSAGQYVTVFPPLGITGMSIATLFPNISAEIANASFASFMEEVAAQGFSASSSINEALINDAAAPQSDSGALDAVIGSRLIPIPVYRDNAKGIGDAYKALLDAKVSFIQEILVGGGRVSENANISSAIHPKWRTAKSEIVIAAGWADTTPPEEVEAIREGLTQKFVPILDALAGPGGATYSNEADVRDPSFRTTFYGDYDRLSAIKRVYDPKDLFIVGAGVGSERWDAYGLCKIA